MRDQPPQPHHEFQPPLGSSPGAFRSIVSGAKLSTVWELSSLCLQRISTLAASNRPRLAIMKVVDKYNEKAANGETFFSFEYFPPRTEEVRQPSLC
jgi:hypothetical protein